MAENKLILGYWAFRGLAQPVRFLLEYLGVEYTEKQYTTYEEWHGKDKKGLGIDFPNLPYIIDGEISLTESFAILVYLIKKNNRLELLGADKGDALSESRVYQVIGVLKDTAKEIGGLCFNPDFKNIKDKLYEEKLSLLLKKTADFLAQKQFLLDNLTLADFLFYEQLQYFKNIYPQSITPQLQEYITRFENLPKIKEYLASDRIHKKQFLPPICAWSGIQ